MTFFKGSPDPEVARDWRRALIDLAIVAVLILIAVGVFALVLATR